MHYYEDEYEWLNDEYVPRNVEVDTSRVEEVKKREAEEKTAAEREHDKVMYELMLLGKNLKKLERKPKTERDLYDEMLLGG